MEDIKDKGYRSRHDSLINKVVWKDGLLMNAHKRSVKLKTHININKYLLQRYSDSTSIKETLYRIYRHVEEKPKCKYCGKPTMFIGRINKPLYQDYCSNSCAAKGTNRGHLWYEGQKKYNMEKYGIDNNFNLPWLEQEKIRMKIHKTCLEKYGVFCNLVSKENIDKMIESKRKNHTFNTSKPEEELYLYIKEKFPSVVRQYKDKERYPFCCGFYIPELDLFLELNGMWTHGEHAYNKEKDKNKLIKKKKKSKNSNFYKCAIKVWTIKDPEKRDCANRNHLNFKEVWSLKEGKEFIDNLYEKREIP